MNHPNRNAVKANNHHRGFFCWGCDSAIVIRDKKCPVCGKRNIVYKRRFGIATQRRLKEEE